MQISENGITRKQVYLICQDLGFCPFQQCGLQKPRTYSEFSQRLQELKLSGYRKSILAKAYQISEREIKIRERFYQMYQTAPLWIREKYNARFCKIKTLRKQFMIDLEKHMAKGANYSKLNIVSKSEDSKDLKGYKFIKYL